jgi:hypothetical protein
MVLPYLTEATVAEAPPSHGRCGTSEREHDSGPFGDAEEWAQPPLICTEMTLSAGMGGARNRFRTGGAMSTGDPVRFSVRLSAEQGWNAGAGFHPVSVLSRGNAEGGRNLAPLHTVPSRRATGLHPTLSLPANNLDDRSPHQPMCARFCARWGLAVMPSEPRANCAALITTVSIVSSSALVSALQHRRS